MVDDWKHRPNIDPETIAEILREAREENDKKFDSYIEYAKYMVEKNKEILDKLGSDYDENGVPYWEKWETNGGRKESNDWKSTLYNTRYGYNFSNICI